MRKRSIILTLLLLSVMISGCSNSNAKESTSEEKITTTSSTATKSTIPFVLNLLGVVKTSSVGTFTSKLWPLILLVPPHQIALSGNSILRFVPRLF